MTNLTGVHTANSWVRILTPEGPSSSSWGHVTVGSGTKDLALFLTLSLTKEQQDEWTHALVDAYYTSLIAGCAMSPPRASVLLAAAAAVVTVH
jgi:hypothetical protein